MREKVSIITILIILLFVVFNLTLSAVPYKPYPILLVHGIGSNSGTWGAPTILRSDSIPEDSIRTDHTYSHFLDYMNTYAIEWWKIDKSYTHPDFSPAYPNKTFLEIINFDDPWGTIDPDAAGYNSDEFNCQGWELSSRIREVLNEYYGSGWEENDDAKVILISHSLGNLAIREALTLDPTLIDHVHKWISAGATHTGSLIATPFHRDMFLGIAAEWYPGTLLADVFLSGMANSINTYLRKSINWYPGIDNHFRDNQDIYKFLIAAAFSLYLTTQGEGQNATLLWAGYIYSEIVEDCMSDLYDEYLNDFFPSILGSYMGGLWGVTSLAAYIEAWAGGPLSSEDDRLKDGKAISDLNRNSDLIENLGSPGAGKIKCVSLIGTHFLDAPGHTNFNAIIPVGWGSEAFIVGVAAACSFWNPSKALEWWGKAAKGLTSMMFILDYHWNADFWTDKNSQNLNTVDPRYNSEVVYLREQYDHGIYHTDETAKWYSFRDVIPDRPIVYWDKIIDVDGEEIQIPDENQEDKISINLGEQRPDSLIGSIDDYFLAESNIYVSFNFGDWQKLNWMEDFGYNENHFILRGLANEKVIFPGWNQIQVKAKNLLGEWGRTRTLRVKWDPFKTYIDFLSLNNEDCFKSPLDTTIKVFFESNLSVIEAETLHINFNNSQFKDTVVLLGEYSDTLNCPIYIEEGEGVYTMEAIAVGVPNEAGNRPVTKNIERFFIDNTPPEPLITLPKKIDTVVHSSRVQEQMPIVFKSTDNFDSLINKPLNGKIPMEIMDSSFNLVWEDTIGACFYQLPKGIYWDFQDSDDNTVTNSGKYYIIISCLDKAGNFGSDTSFFFLDNEPPVITVLSPFDSILTSNEDCVELDYQVNEDAEIQLKWTDTDEKWVTRDGYATSEPDTNHFFEGADMFGDYIADGLYTLQFTAKDNVGNDTTYNDGIVQGNALRVDRTAPTIKNFDIHWMTNINDTLDVTFSVSEEEDERINKGRVKIKIYIDASPVDSIEKSPDDPEIQINEEYNISKLSKGVHKVIVSAEDQWGNRNIRLTEIVKGTIGTRITLPEEGDTLGQGIVMIKGLANDPDMYNSQPFEGFGLYYKRYSSDEWDSTGIIVPENLREPGIPKNRGSKYVPNELVLGRWDVELLSGFYDLMLRSWEVEGEELSDTHTIYIDEQEEITAPKITWSVEIEGDEDGVFEPDTGELIVADYQLSVKPADIYFDVLNQSGRNMAHIEEKGIMPVSLSKPSPNKEGLYVYFYDNNWWIKCKLEGFGMSSGEILSLENESLTITETSDTLMVPLNLTGSKIEFNCINIFNSPYYGWFSFTGKGRIQFNLTFNESHEIWVGGCKLESPFALKTADTIYYNGTEFGAGQIPGGTYTLRLSAEGMDGMGYHKLTEEILVETDLRIENSLTSDIAYPLEDLPATVEYKVNQKAGVKIDVYKGSDFFLHLENIDSVAGGTDLHSSWNGLQSDGLSYKTGNDYRFKSMIDS